MPFKTKEKRNEYMKKYYLDNPDKLKNKREWNKNYMRNKRLEDKLNEEDYKNNLSYAGESLI